MQEDGLVIQPEAKIRQTPSGRIGTHLQFESVGINEASTGHFICRSHDEAFKEIDHSELDTSDQRTFDLLMYRATLKELWIQLRIFETNLRMRDARPFRLPLDPEIKLRAVVDLATRLKVHLETPSETESQSKIRTIHLVRHIKSEIPFLAAASAGSSADSVIDKRTGEIATLGDTRRYTGKEPNTSWTFTIIPRKKDHVVVASYIEESTSERFFNHIEKANGAELQQAVSAELLMFCENWFINPKIWEIYGKKRQEAIKKTYDNVDGLLDGRYRWANKRKNDTWYEHLEIGNRQQVNLFRY